MEDLKRQLIKDLVIESIEGLDNFDADLLLLESGEADPETLNRIFRAIHTVKGSSGCLGLKRIEGLAHVGENLLSLMREGRLNPEPALMTKLFSYADRLRQMFGTLDATGSEGDDDYSGLAADLDALCTAVLKQESALQTAAKVQADETDLTGIFGLFADEEEEPVAAAPSAPPEESPAEIANVSPSPAEKHATRSASSAESAIRIDVSQLDVLMDLVGELVLARNQILQYAGTTNEPILINSTQRLNLITTKLQGNIMKTRMQPIGNVWGKFPRIVRDLSVELGKKVSLLMDGQETEIDRTILDAIKDPLTHIIRNSVDHGIEMPEARMAHGKPAEGKLLLRAFHEGGRVIIEITDDGAGIDRERLVRKAIDKRLIGVEQANRLTERETLDLIFFPGFSTAEKVTSISGRGVGMDVVKSNVERIGGSVDIETKPGRSTTIRIKIPLTLAIIPALIIGSGNARYAIPQTNLEELVRIDPADPKNGVEHIGTCSMYRLRGNLLPLVHLGEQLEIAPTPESKGAPMFLLVLQAEGRRFGLVVDRVFDTEEIVVKPLVKELKHLTTYAGATIMGDGQVALILDIIGLARRAQVLQDSSNTHFGNTKEQSETGSAQRQFLLLVVTSPGRHSAIPLSAVSRLEEFKAGKIELAGAFEVVQYRQKIMPLVRINRVLGYQDGAESSVDEPLRIVVSTLEGKNFGLVVDRVIDVVEADPPIQSCKDRPGVLGLAIVQERVTDFLDLPELIRMSGVTSLGF